MMIIKKCNNDDNNTKPLHMISNMRILFMGHVYIFIVLIVCIKGNHVSVITLITNSINWGYVIRVLSHWELRINNHPDDDFVFMTKSKYFVISGGAFSRYIGEFVRRNKGIVISDFITDM